MMTTDSNTITRHGGPKGHLAVKDDPYFKVDHEANRSDYCTFCYKYKCYHCGEMERDHVEHWFYTTTGKMKCLFDATTFMCIRDGIGSQKKAPTNGR